MTADGRQLTSEVTPRRVPAGAPARHPRDALGERLRDRRLPWCHARGLRHLDRGGGRPRHPRGRGRPERLRVLAGAGRPPDHHPRAHRPLRHRRRGGQAQQRGRLDAPADQPGYRQVPRPGRGGRPAPADAGRPRHVRSGAGRRLKRAAGLDAGHAVDRRGHHLAAGRRALRGRRAFLGGDPHPRPFPRPCLPVVSGRPHPAVRRPPPARHRLAGDVRARLRARSHEQLPELAPACGGAGPGPGAAWPWRPVPGRRAAGGRRGAGEAPPA